jgi:hypothetical protein
MQDNKAMIDVEQTGGEAALFEPAQRLAELLAASETGEPRARPNRLPHKAITKMPELFQPRGMSEKHIGDLVRAIQNFGEVDPLTVIAVGSKAVLIDGHHRLEAYQRAKKLAGIPVTYFDGTPQEAVLEAGRANSKAKLPMSGQERQNYDRPPIGRASNRHKGLKISVHKPHAVLYTNLIEADGAKVASC